VWKKRPAEPPSRKGRNGDRKSRETCEESKNGAGRVPGPSMEREGILKRGKK